ncbi:outer membrane lipoprotein-sorting protein [Thalassotalea castellviae]|uniref:Outer membrane lipoprotein-sorting protein n=1 Tax=Thalassotalea castellviae TaxID=3075612 RepID=A0ABU3A0U3_9GAMM|nr:outer membrane lipoprotein-sorting protein [Thalassotalea sp. W431]MDT0603167.1 outer membrane lipoprotein-sorting protein [Thalassotalea sp. W431]
MMLHFLKKTQLITLSFLSLITAAHATVNVDSIIKKSNLASYYAGEDGSAQARMIIVDANGNKQMRQFTILRKDQEDLGDQDMLVFFSRPTDVQGTVFRVTKKVQADDDRWLYLPALDLVKRISAGDKRTSFVGAHFYYEDVSGRNPAEDNYSLISSDEESYIMKAVPKDPSSVEYAYYHIIIDKNTYLPMKASYFNEQQEIIREMQVLAVQNIDGFPTVVHAKMTQLSDGSFTEMQFRNVKYNVGLPDNIFSERSLRTPPKAWLR